jgi:sigma-B regulation protein RsbU (phosphoserine phosphatase)
MNNNLFEDNVLIKNNFDFNLKKKLNKQILKLFEPQKDYGEVIFKLALNRYYIQEDQNVLELSKDLDKHDDIPAVGVVDNERKVLGIIIKEELSLILSRPHGRDVFKNRAVKSIIKKVKIFQDELSILQAAEELDNDLRLVDNHYYIMADNNNRFTGVFSNKSILIYLSEITQKDLNLAEKIQKSIVKEDFIINSDNIKLVAVSKMARGVGGDFYTVKKINDYKWVLSVCDVSGKGINASLLTCILGGIFNSYDFRKGLKNFIDILNAYIINTFKHEKFITGVIMEYDEKSHEAVICDLGHSFVYICKDNKILKLKQHDENLPIGIKEKLTPKGIKVKLNKEDFIIIFTDGLIEQTDSYSKMYTEEKLKNLIKSNNDKSIYDLKNIILDDFFKFKGSYQQIDDLTFLLLKC